MRLWHRHIWVEVQRDVGSGISIDVLAGARETNIPMTLITYKCECGKYKQRTIAGQITA